MATSQAPWRRPLLVLFVLFAARFGIPFTTPGDEWWHIITVEKTDAEPDPCMSYPTAIAERGEAPPQYQDYDEGEE